MNTRMNPEVLAILERVASGSEVTTEDRLTLSLSRPMPTFMEASCLKFVHATRFAKAASPVREWHLQFLRDHLSKEVFDDLMSPLRLGNEAVTYDDIHYLSRRKNQQKRLQSQVIEIQTQRGLAVAQKRFAGK